MFRIISCVSVLLLACDAQAEDPKPATAPAASTTTTSPAPPAAAPATAPAVAPAAAPTFDSLDANKDGSLDKAEIAKVADLVAQTATVDGDKNGKLSRAEFDGWAAKQKPAAAPSGTPTSAPPPATPPQK